MMRSGQVRWLHAHPAHLTQPAGGQVPEEEGVGRVSHKVAILAQNLHTLHLGSCDVKYCYM